MDMQKIKGLSAQEVEEKRKKYGLNTIEEHEESWLERLFRRFWGPIPWMIEVAAILSAVAKRWEDFTIIMILLFVNAFVDFYQESKALNAIKVLKQKLAHKATALRDGKWIQIDAKELVPEDVVKIKIGDIVPADMRLYGEEEDEGTYLQVDQSALTGESLPVHKKAGDILYANATIKQGEMIGEVVNTGKNTYFGKTVGLVAKAQLQERSHFQKMVIRVGNFLILLTLIMIAFIIYHGVQTHQPTLELLIFALVLTISAIPVAMPAVLTVTMAIGAKALAKKEAIVSRLVAIEELAGMDILCSDKTGTLTKNEMVISEPFTVGKYTVEDLITYAIMASQLQNHDPIEKPIFDFAQKNKFFKDYKVKKFIPFDPVRKRTEAVLDEGKCELVVTKGAPQVIIELSDTKAFDKDKVYQKVEEFANNGFRTLGVGYRHCEEDKYHFVGLIPLYDPLRDDSAETIEEARSKGVDIKMVTGDNLAVAKYIASLLDIEGQIQDIRELKGESISEYLTLATVLSKAFTKVLHPDTSKKEIEKLSSEIVQEVQKELYDTPLPQGSVKKHESEIIEMIEKTGGFAQVFPEDKYFIVDTLQKADHIVGMTGDGVNDAPALKKADCGIAVSGATDAARAAADIVLLAPGLKVIVDAIKEARQIFERMKSYTIFRIAETIRVIVFMTLVIVIYDFYPITALMIIILALLNDIPIMTIAYDNTKVREKPVRWDMKEVFILASWLGLAGVLSSFALFWVLMSLMHLPLDFVQTAFFAKLVIAGHGTIYNTRIDDWFWKRPWPSWTLFNATFFSRVAGTIIAVYGFDLMEPIGWEWALAMWVYALIWFVFNDAIKMIVLRYYRKKLGMDII